MDKNTNKPEKQPNNPLHGVKLADILTFLIDEYGFKSLSDKINVNCFKSNPTYKSCLKFFRTTPWAREELEELYLETKRLLD